MELGQIDYPRTGVAFDDYPATAMLKMQHWLNTQYEAICWLLAADDLEPVAYGMTRGLLEGWAHYSWVYGTNVEGRRCRALRLDRMFAKEEFDAARLSGEADQLGVRQLRVDRLAKLARDTGCTGEPRRHTAVSASLGDIERATGANWPLLMWRQTSLITHQMGFSWLVQDNEDGSNVFRQPTVEDRAVRLYYATIIYQSCGELFLSIIGSIGRVQSLKQAVQDLIETPALVVARDLAHEG